MLKNNKQIFSAVLNTHDLELVINWKEKQLGADKTVEGSDADSVKCNKNIFQIGQIFKTHWN